MPDSYKPRILYTEDDPDTSELLRLLFEMEGFDVTCAEDPAQALSLATTEKFDPYLFRQLDAGNGWRPSGIFGLRCFQVSFQKSKNVTKNAGC